MKPVCLVIGAGAGIGGTVGTKFASEGYHSVLCRRTDKEGLDRLVDGIKSAGGEATGMLLNALDENSIEDAVTHVEANIGPIEVVIYNLGAQIGDRTLEDTSYKAFEMGWRLGTFGLFRLAKTVCPSCQIAAVARSLSRLRPLRFGVIKVNTLTLLQWAAGGCCARR